MNVTEVQVAERAVAASKVARLQVREIIEEVDVEKWVHD